MDVPRPHPGQKSRPIYLRGHNEKWSLPVSRHPRMTKPAIQNIASNGSRLVIRSGEKLSVKKAFWVSKGFCETKFKSTYHETSIEYCFVFLPKSGVTPHFEVIDFIS
jgi:hypothetical protein